MSELYAMHMLNDQPDDRDNDPIEVAQNISNSVDSGRRNETREMELAQAYVLEQPLEGIFPPEEGLRMGTAFPNLSMPYMGR